MCAQSCLTLVTVDCGLPGSSVPGIFRARTLEGAAVPPPGDFPNPGIEPMSPAGQADSLPLSHLGSLQRQERRPQFYEGRWWKEGKGRELFIFIL